MNLGRIAACLVVLGSGACSKGLDQVWQLQDYRVLGVKTLPAEASHGDTVTMQLVDADNQQRPVQTAWFLCGSRVSPFSSDTADGGTGCPSDQLQLQSGPQAMFQVPPQTGTPDSLGRETFLVYAFSCAGGTIGPPSDSTGLPQCNGQNAEGWLFTRTLYVHDPMSLNPPNQNPQITEVRLGATVPSTLDPNHPPTVPRCTTPSNPSMCTQEDLQVFFSPASRESYQSPDAINGVITVKQERMTVGFVITDGTLAGGFRTDSDIVPVSPMDNLWTPPSVAETVTLYLYASDGRGGFDWTTRTITVQ